jgi:hypothetical protein
VRPATDIPEYYSFRDRTGIPVVDGVLLDPTNAVFGDLCREHSSPRDSKSPPVVAIAKLLGARVGRIAV